MRTFRQITFVVHGVGAPETERDAIDSATRAFANKWGALNDVHLQREMYVSHPEEGESIEYAVFRGRMADGSIHDIVELQWADLSTAPEGAFGAATAFLELLLGLRRLLKACSDCLEGMAARIGAVANFLLGIIEGPILGFNVVQAAILIFLIVWPWEITPRSALMLIGSVGILPWFIQRTPSLKPAARSIPIMRWSAIFGAVVLVIAVLDPDYLLALAYIMPSNRGLTGFSGHIAGIGVLTGSIWLIINVLIMAVVLAWIILRVKATGYRRETFDLQVFGAALAIRLWLFALPLLWNLALRLFPDQPASGLVTGEEIGVIVESFMPVLGLGWLIGVFIALGGMWTVFSFNRESARTGEEHALNARMIVAAPLKWIVTLSTFVLPIVVSLIFIQSISTSPVAWVDTFTSRLYHVNDFAWLLTGGFAVVVFFFREKLRTALDFALDITKYFGQDGEHGRSDISSRFDAVINDVIGMTPAPNDLLFVSHSQGTVLIGDYFQMKHIDADAVNGLSLKERQKRIARATWVTLGSPIGHIYQHYFSDIFWSADYFREKKPIGKWYNFYRTHDYIGKRIEPMHDRQHRDASSDFLIEESLGEGSHTGYFSGDDLHQKLIEKRLVPGIKFTRGNATDSSESLKARNDE